MLNREQKENNTRMKLYIAIVVVSVGFSCTQGHSKLIFPWMLHKTSAYAPSRINGDAEFPVHSIQRRQMQTDEGKCQEAYTRLSCHQKGLIQQFIDVDLQCGVKSEETGIGTKFCDINSGGKYCDLIDSNNAKIASTTKEQCSTSLKSNNCLTECANALQTARKNIGCCINSKYNNSGSSFNYTLWSLCGVETVGTCASTITVIPQRNRVVCSQDELNNRLYDVYCSSTHNTILNTVRHMEHCEEFGNEYIDTCRVNSKQQLCLLIPSVHQALNPAMGQCAVNQSTCPLNCTTALNKVRNDLGCCVNALFNKTDVATTHQNLTSYELWNQCNVLTPPITCPSLLGGAAGMEILFPINSVMDKLLLVLTFMMVATWNVI